MDMMQINAGIGLLWALFRMTLAEIGREIALGQGRCG
jgi:hypothetical protein